MYTLIERNLSDVLDIKIVDMFNSYIQIRTEQYAELRRTVKEIETKHEQDLKKIE
jgi:hypothetical protein